MKHILLTLFLASAACGAETLDITKDWRAMPVKVAAGADVAKVLPESGTWTDGAALAGKIPLAEGAKNGLKNGLKDGLKDGLKNGAKNGQKRGRKSGSKGTRK